LFFGSALYIGLSALIYTTGCGMIYVAIPEKCDILDIT
jgi:hypothetical protein